MTASPREFFWVAPLAGTVSELAVAPDDQVKEGDLIAVIE